MTSSEALNDSVVTFVLVDVAKNPIYRIRKSVLCTTSAYFQTSRRTGQSQSTINMTGIDENAMNDYLLWLIYRDRAPDSFFKFIVRSEDQTPDQIQSFYMRLSRAFILGEQLVDLAYQTLAFRLILWVKSTMEYPPGPAAAKIIYDGTPAGSPARKLLVDIFVTEACDDRQWSGMWARFIQDYPHAMMRDVVMLFIRRRRPISFKTNAR